MPIPAMVPIVIARPILSTVLIVGAHDGPVNIQHAQTRAAYWIGRNR